MRKRRRDKPVLLISAGVLIAPIFYIDSLDAAMTGLGQLSASLFFSAVFYRAAVALNRAHLGRGIGERDMTALFLTAGACCAAAAPYCMRGVSLGGILAAFTALILSGSVGIYAVACAAVAGAGAAIGGGSVAFAGAVVIGALSASALRKGKRWACARLLRRVPGVRIFWRLRADPWHRSYDSRHTVCYDTK